VKSTVKYCRGWVEGDKGSKLEYSFTIVSVFLMVHHLVGMVMESTLYMMVSVKWWYTVLCPTITDMQSDVHRPWRTSGGGKFSEPCGHASNSEAVELEASIHADRGHEGCVLSKTDPSGHICVV
jgi:hypothetical protein